MKLPKYQLKADKSLMVFEFTSEGPKGRIPKLVKYTRTNLNGIFNLEFGDKEKDSDEIDDMVVTNNGDSEKVLATVVSTIYLFTDKYPKAIVVATGSTKSRTRLYRMGVSKYLEEIQKHFIIYGLLNGKWITFKKAMEFEEFMVKRKNIAKFEL